MKTRTIQYLALALLLGACQKEMQEASPVTENSACAPEIIAETESGPATKTMISVDGNGTGTIMWMPGDQINVFYGTESTCYTAQNGENATTAVFHTEDILENASNNIWGLYPYNVNATSTGAAISTTLPAAQSGVPETFDDDLFITLAHSNNTTLQFYNVCGGIKFSLSREDITSITFKGNNNEDIAGDISLTFDGEPSRPKATVVNGLKEITLTPKTGPTFAKNTNYYIIALSGALSRGFTMTFNTTSGSVGTLNHSTGTVTIKRSVFSKKAEIDTYATFEIIPSVPVPEAVDLGLLSGTKWASFNLGASAPEEYGDYYAWGETEPYYSSLDPLTWKEGKEVDGYYWSTYKWCKGTNSTMTKYCSDSAYGDNGFTDTRTVLDLEDDAAHANLGGKWRMPTYADWTELIDKCTRTWTQQNGVDGYLLTSSNGKSIFLPAAGARKYLRSENVDRKGYYWSSSLFTDYPNYPDLARSFGFDSINFACGDVFERYRGQSVRPVTE